MSSRPFWPDGFGLPLFGQAAKIEAQIADNHNFFSKKKRRAVGAARRDHCHTFSEAISPSMNSAALSGDIRADRPLTKDLSRASRGSSQHTLTSRFRGRGIRLLLARCATLRRRAEHVRSAQVFQTSTSSAIGGAACLYLWRTM
jgi:hypothetical protein